ncbi:MAG: hypothetical protein KY445_11460 [Armatimonadetes bacterium]|nr:hypothetical protein [Armatimonadota bacterium]
MADTNKIEERTIDGETVKWDKDAGAPARHFTKVHPKDETETAPATTAKTDTAKTTK